MMEYVVKFQDHLTAASLLASLHMAKAATAVHATRFKSSLQRSNPCCRLLMGALTGGSGHVVAQQTVLEMETGLPQRPHG